MEADPEDRSLIASLMPELEAAEPERRAEAVDRARVVLSGNSDALIALGLGLSMASFPGSMPLSAQAFLEALRAHPDSPAAIEGIARALRDADELEDAEPVIEEALQLTQRDPRILLASADWLGAHGHDNRRGVLAEEVLTHSLGQLEAAPDDLSVITLVVAALKVADPEVRSDAVYRVTTTLSGHLDGLVRFGDGLWRQNFPDCGLIGARVLLEALRTHPGTPEAVGGIASALEHIDSIEQARPIAEEALQLSGYATDLLSAWVRRLDRAGQAATAVPVLPRGSQYGRCPCSGTYEQRKVEVRFRIRDEPVVLKDVPQGACPSCGSRVYKRNVLAVLETLMKRSAAAPRE